MGSITQVIFTGDDFGRNNETNSAIEKSCRDGVLTSASLMMTGAAVEEAVSIARKLPELAVGLHLSLSGGRPVSSVPTVPALVDSQGMLKTDPAAVGLLLQYSRQTRLQAEREIAAQFQAFVDSGLALRHVDSHHHVHIHPWIFNMVLKYGKQYGIGTVRIPVEPWHISARLSCGHTIRNWMYGYVFGALGVFCQRKADKAQVGYADGVFGLYQTGEVNRAWLLALLDRLAAQTGIFEIYTHPIKDEQGPGVHELAALCDPQVREKLSRLQIQTVSYEAVLA